MTGRHVLRPIVTAATCVTCALALTQAAWAASDVATEMPDDAYIRLERRVADLETELDAAREDASRSVQAGSSDWTRYVRLGGSANLGWYDGQEDGLLAGAGFQVRDARLFVDAELGQSLELFGHTVVRNAGFSFEWDLVRIGLLRNTVGEAYAELQGIAGSDWLNLRLGRFQIPVGEAYLRYSHGRWKNPFVSQPVTGTWWWDEGVAVYGGGFGGWLSYVASITDNETALNTSESSQKQYSLKLKTEPQPWLALSASFLYGGRIGSATSPGSGGGLWLGETWGRGIGVNSSLQVYQDGVAVPDGPLDVESTWFAGGDVIFDFEDKARLWLSYGAWNLESPDASYDRRMQSWIAELVVQAQLLSPVLDGIYVGVRGSGLGTYDGGRGYSYDFRTLDQFGYNMRSLEEVSAVIGWWPVDPIVLRFEYTHRRVTLVDGSPQALQDASDDLDLWAIEIGVHF